MRSSCELARLDLGEVEDVVDQPQQGVARFGDDLEEVALPGRERALQHQFGHADDGVHGRADLVAHVGQERALGPAGGLRRFLGLGQFRIGAFQLRRPLPDAVLQFVACRAQFLFRLLALGHVVHQAREHPPPADVDLADGEVHGEDRAVLAPADHLAADADDLPLARAAVVVQVGVVHARGRARASACLTLAPISSASA